MPPDVSSRAKLEPVGAVDRRNALIASFLGWTLDAFDFFIVVMVLTEIAGTFHKSIGALTLTLTVTLAFRPVGAFLLD